MLINIKKMNLLKIILNMSFDAPSPWGICFQDSASPQYEGLIDVKSSTDFEELDIEILHILRSRFFFLPPQ